LDGSCPRSPIVDTISLDLYGLQHATTIMPHSRAREDTAQPSRLPPIRQLRYTTASTNELSEHPSLPRPHFYKLRLREEFLRELHPISRSDGQKLIVEVVTRVMQHARAGPMASIAMAAHAVPEKGITSRLG
jgi:hypothetical protein